MRQSIVIKGARAHNLKNIDLEIPRDKLVVFTGLSGSGKSSLAFDTIYAEGQRRYVESLSSYARQFLGQMEKPDVDYIDGLSPAISIDQDKDHQQEPALHRGHGHGDSRLPAPFVRAHRHAALPPVRASEIKAADRSIRWSIPITRACPSKHAHTGARAGRSRAAKGEYTTAYLKGRAEARAMCARAWTARQIDPGADAIALDKTKEAHD